MNKIVLIIILLSLQLVSKECYNSKGTKICYYKYFASSKIDGAKIGERYYIDKNKKIYSFDDIIEVRFKSVGGIFQILNNFEVEFYDKTKSGIYQFKVKDKNELFIIASKINELDSVMKAHPKRVRKFTKEYVLAQKKLKQERFKAAMKRAGKSVAAKKTAPKEINKMKYVEEDDEKVSFF
jgi:hypothetical protein